MRKAGGELLRLAAEDDRASAETEGAIGVGETFEEPAADGAGAAGEDEGFVTESAPS